MKKTILITGVNGLLGQYLSIRLDPQQYTMYGCGKGECRLNTPHHILYDNVDITDTHHVHQYIQKVQPHIIVHCAAMTQVDDCELQQQEAFRQNVLSTKNLINAARGITHRPHFIFISTDFIFKGDAGPYDEEALPDPVNYYGKTKMWGEFLVMQSGLLWSIARTILVYGKPLSGARNNIVEWIKGKLENNNPLQMVADQFRTPAYLPNLADGIARIAEQTALGIFNICGEEMLTPFDIAVQVADFFHLDKTLITQSNSTMFTQPATRPLRTGLIIDKAKNELGYQPLTFKKSLEDMYPSTKPI